KPWERL
uniref:Tryptophyllin-T2-7 n=1 Tax=Pithecopus azureus TaxID=2034991 RepID=TY27_PITAZ|nr:RecName: Full=Tryptophyllin-T2-7; Short=Pha-T2-7; AltName: Full=Tryptophyllin-7 [Pithecopus azureus]